MKTVKAILLFSSVCVFLILVSCKKVEVLTHVTNLQAEVSLLRVDKFFPNGVLSFNSTTSIKSFWDKLVDDPYYANKSIANFKSLQNWFDDFRTRESANASRVTGKAFTNSNTSKELSVINGISTSDAPLNVDATEFMYDMNTNALPTENLAGLLNPSMQVIVADTLFQFTRIGLLKASVNSIQDYNNFIAANKSSIFYNQSFQQFPNEVAMSNSNFLVKPNIVRQDFGATTDLFRKILYISDNGGISNGTTGYIPQNDNYYVNITINKDDNFNKEVGIIFNDWAKRRFVFMTQNINHTLFGWGFHKIDIKAKVQREKKFLGFTYWGESFADELTVGCDNMNLETDYIFPFPQDFINLARPTFEGLADFQVGNNMLKTLNIKANISALGFSLNNSQISSFINGQFNSFAGNTYNNIFKDIENNLLNSIDPTYLSRYAAYTKKINTIKDDRKLKWVIGKAEKVQGYSHANTWRFDWNIGGTIISKGGGVGGYPLQYNYNYDMKGGSFFGKAKVGTVWHGIRIIKI